MTLSIFFCFPTDDTPMTISVLSIKAIFPHFLLDISPVISNTHFKLSTPNQNPDSISLCPLLPFPIYSVLHSIHQQALLAPPSKYFSQPLCYSSGP